MAHPGQSTAVHVQPATTGTALRTCRILVVDHEHDMAELHVKLLEMLGQRVERAYDGRTAVAQARRFRPDIVMLDLDTPGMDGAAVARELRRFDLFARLRIVGLSASPAQDGPALRMAGFDGFLKRPAGIAGLVSLLRERR